MSYCVKCPKEIRASFGYTCDKLKIRCAKHKEDGMVNLKAGCKTCIEKCLPKVNYAYYGYWSDMKKHYCKDHKDNKMANIHELSKKCVRCIELKSLEPKFACFTKPGNDRKTHCSKHRTEDMINLYRKENSCEICDRFASYGWSHDRKKTRCAKHSDADMIRLSYKPLCKVCLEKEDKETIAGYGFIQDNKRIRCVTHSEPGMVDLAHKNVMCEKCAEIGIEKGAGFGSPEDGKLTRCAEHQEKGMIDYKNYGKFCDECLLIKDYKQSCFGFLSDGILSKCKTHRKDGMIDLAHINQLCKECIDKGKKNPPRAIYGYESDNKKLTCGKHKDPGMIDLNNKSLYCTECRKQGVTELIRANYGWYKDKKRTHCTTHRDPEMVNFKYLYTGCVTCREEEKLIRAGYGKLFEKKIHCEVHAQPNEFKNNNPKCSKTGCKERPTYGKEKVDIIPKRCIKHINAGDIDILSRECESCLLESFIPSTQTKCARCLGWKISNNIERKKKENQVASCLLFLANVTGMTEPIQDKTIKGGCSRKRPDFLYKDFTDIFSLIVEVDEHQHSKYSCSIQGEMQRMITIYEEDSGGFPLIFIRFNPDPYYKKGDVVQDYNGREDVLKDTIKGLKNRTKLEDFPIGVVYLYYDNFEDVKIEPLKYETVNGELIIKHKHPLSTKTEHIYKL